MTAEMAEAKVAAYVSGAAEAAHMCATTETATVSTPTPTSSAARKCVSGESSSESGSRRQDDHSLS
jgi:hypothetical protein